MNSKHCTFVVAVNNLRIFEDNFLASPCLAGLHSHEVIVQSGFRSASEAYNDGLDKARNELVIFVHQDVILTGGWLGQLDYAIGRLEITDPSWGVLGCYGETRDDGGHGHVYSTGLGIIGKPFDEPVPVQTLDEIVLVLRKSSGLRFDSDLPNFHFYGTDICLRAADRGRKSYAMSAFCIHNSNQGPILPKDFYRTYKWIKRIWRHRMPIQTPCIRITRFDFPLWSRKMYESYLRLFRGRRPDEGQRVADVRQLQRDVAAVLEARSTCPGAIEASPCVKV